MSTSTFHISYSTHPHRPSPQPMSHPAHFSTQGPCRQPGLHHHPLTTPLDELVQQQRQILQDEPADVKGKELGSVPGAELEPDLRLVRMSEARVLNLASDLVYVINQR